MLEYVTLTLWRQREERMPRELEQQRVVQERLSEQQQEQEQEQQSQPQQQPTVSPETSVADASEPVAQTGEPERVLANR